MLQQMLSSIRIYAFLFLSFYYFQVVECFVPLAQLLECETTFMENYIIESVICRHVWFQLFCGNLFYMAQSSHLLVCDLLNDPVSQFVLLKQKCGVNSISLHVFVVQIATGNLVAAESDSKYVEVINAYLKPKCHPPDSESVRRYRTS